MHGHISRTWSGEIRQNRSVGAKLPPQHSQNKLDLSKSAVLAIHSGEKFIRLGHFVNKAGAFAQTQIAFESLGELSVVENMFDILANLA